jgi:hypothetical protein
MEEICPFNKRKTEVITLEKTPLKSIGGVQPPSIDNHPSEEIRHILAIARTCNNLREVAAMRGGDLSRRISNNRDALRKISDGIERRISQQPTLV